MNNDTWDKPVYDSEGKLLANNYDEYSKGLGPNSIDWSKLREVKMNFKEWINLHDMGKWDSGYSMAEAAWQAATKAALGSRVVLPSDEECLKQADYESERGNTYSCPDSARAAFLHACDWYTDAIKLIPLTAEQLLPSEEWVEAEYEKFDNDKSRTQDNPAWPEWVATERDYWMECYKVVSESIKKRLGAV